MSKRYHHITVLILYAILPWTLSEESTQHGEKSNFYMLKVKDPVAEVNCLESNTIPVWKAKLNNNCKLPHLHPSLFISLSFRIEEVWVENINQLGEYSWPDNFCTGFFLHF